MQDKFKYLLCKNDDCLKLLAQIQKKEEKPGLILRIRCNRCSNLNEWRFGYSQVEEDFDRVKDIVEKGGGN